jgi:hypothetical protein
MLDDGYVILQRLLDGELLDVGGVERVTRTSWQRQAIEAMLWEQQERTQLDSVLEHEAVVLVASIGIGLSSWTEEHRLQHADRVVGRWCAGVVLGVHQISLAKRRRVTGIEVIELLIEPELIRRWWDVCARSRCHQQCHKCSSGAQQRCQAAR